FAMETGNGVKLSRLILMHCLASWASIALVKLLLLADMDELKPAGCGGKPCDKSLKPALCAANAAQTARPNSKRKQLLTMQKAIVDSRINRHQGRAIRVIRNPRTAPRRGCAKRAPQREQKVVWTAAL